MTGQAYSHEIRVLTETQLQARYIQISRAEKRKKNRLIKVKVLSNSDDDAKGAAESIEEATGAIAVDVRGSVIVLTDKRTWTSLSQKKFRGVSDA